MEDGVTYIQSFNAENRLIAVTVDGATTHFIYDGDGNPSTTPRKAAAPLRAGLIKQIKPDGSRTLYVGGIYEVNKDSSDAETGNKTYYPAAGAMRDGSTLYYMMKDHLGSASVLTTDTGNIVPGAETRYYPFGEARFTGPMVTDKLFTGQRQIAELGIYHYGARFYSPKLGRFLSADTIVPGYANPQNLNRFSYVTNNPLRYTDPTGHRPDEGQAGKRGCSNPRYCNNGHMKSKQELAAMRREKRNGRKAEPLDNFADLFPGQVIGSWNGPKDIDPDEFDTLLGAISFDVHYATPEVLVLEAARYDTPFYNAGNLSGIGCINGKCYTRTELNYIGVGELLAAVGVSKSTGHEIVSAWKNKVPFVSGLVGLDSTPRKVSQGTFEMFDVGFDDYHERYPPGTPPSNHLIMPWTTLWES